MGNDNDFDKRVGGIVVETRRDIMFWLQQQQMLQVEEDNSYRGGWPDVSECPALIPPNALG